MPTVVSVTKTLAKAEFSATPSPVDVWGLSYRWATCPWAFRRSFCADFRVSTRVMVKARPASASARFDRRCSTCAAIDGKRGMHL